jgi:hypothetical protein
MFSDLHFDSSEFISQGLVAVSHFLRDIFK